MTPVSIDCPAKVNLFLRILAREESGHHQIETFFLAVGLYDRVTVGPGDDGIALKIEAFPGAAIFVPPGSAGRCEDNTAYRAARAFYAAAGIRPATVVSVAKRIPAGAGLGGASSDAAGTLAALNLLHREPLSRTELLAIGSGIGSDVPFFCSGEPAAMAWGRGDRLLPCKPPEAASVVIVVPRDRTPTADAYASVSATLDLPAGPAVLSALARGDWDAVARSRGNDFENEQFRRMPVLAETCALLMGEGALLAGLTGSGSAVFGLFATREAAARATARIRLLDDMSGEVVVPVLKRPWLPPH